MEKNTQQNKTRKRSGGSFYAVLSLCLIAVGIAAWSAVSAFTDFKTQTEEIPETSQEPNIEVPETTPEEPAGNEVPNIEYTPEPDNTVEDYLKPSAEYFLMPIQGNILKPFDKVTLQYSKTLHDMRLHEGVDILGEIGTIVRSAGSGTVTEVYKDASLGNVVVIDHGNSIIAKYCGLDKNIPVKSGDKVEPGTEIGTLGTIPIESADNSHLHFEMYKSGSAANPLEIMGMNE